VSKKPLTCSPVPAPARSFPKAKKHGVEVLTDDYAEYIGGDAPRATFRHEVVGGGRSGDAFLDME